MIDSKVFHSSRVETGSKLVVQNGDSQPVVAGLALRGHAGGPQELGDGE